MKNQTMDEKIDEKKNVMEKIGDYGCKYGKMS